MNREDLKALVAQMLQDMQPPAPAASPAASPAQEDTLPDITAVDLRQQYLVSQPKNREAFLALKQKTPARLGLGRAGTRYRTATMLRFRADHAAAQDSVFSLVDEAFAARLRGALGRFPSGKCPRAACGRFRAPANRSDSVLQASFASPHCPAGSVSRKAKIRSR